MSWTAERLARGLVHVAPIGDVIAHDLDEDCVCGPSVEIIPNPDGPDGYMWTHHALDGRE
jgi:hypothetical protein